MQNNSNNDAFFTCPKEVFGLPATMTAKMIYAALCSQRDRDGAIAPSYRELSDTARVHRKTAQTAVKHLQNIGAVMRIPRYADTGAQLSNRYFITAFGEDMRQDSDFKALVKRLNEFMQAVS